MGVAEQTDQQAPYHVALTDQNLANLALYQADRL
jgi:hypothetical protein